MTEEYVPTFLYPTSRQYPFDEVCEQFVRELEKRNWEVPGITVEFRTYGTGEEKYTYLSDIVSENYKLHFGRPQGSLGNKWNDVAAVDSISFPMRELHVYSDESGPTYYVYVGQDWEADKDKFWGWGKVNAKLHNEPRMYLEYKGDSVYSKQRSSGLVPNNDLGRQYGPEAGDALYYSTEAVFEEFQLFLQGVLTYVRGFPLQPIRIVEGPKPIVTFPSTIGPFYTFLDARDARRIQIGQVDRNALEPGDRYGILGGGTRLISIGVPNDGTFPDLAYEGFIYCSLGQVEPGTSLGKFPEFVGREYIGSATAVYQVQPSSAEGFYVYDAFPQEEYKREFFEKNPQLDRLTEEAYLEYQRIPGRFLTPILEYKGGFVKPVILCCRDLDFSELKLVETVS